MAETSRKRVYIKLGDFDVPVKVPGTTDGTFTTGKKNKPVYSKVATSAATALASPTTTFPVTTKANTDLAVVARGTKGAGSIKISLGETTASGAEKFYSVPVPAYFSILDCYACIENVVGTTKIDNVKSFVSRYGVTYPYIKGDLPTGGTGAGDEITPTT